MIEIKPPQETEKAALVALLKTCRADNDRKLLPEYFNDFPESFFTEDWESVFAKPGSYKASVAYNDGIAIGFSCSGPMSNSYRALLTDKSFDEKTGELLQVYVHPDRKGQGLGRRLYDAALGDLAELGYRDFILCTYIANKNACAFYRQMGCENIKDAVLPVKTRNREWQIPVTFFHGAVK